MATKTKSGLPLGVTERKNRPGLYQMRVMVDGKRYSEDYRAKETSKKKLQPELQKVFYAFKERVESGLLKSGDISEKSTFAQAVVWFTEMRKLELRESTQLADNFLFEHYLVPRLGNYKLKEITSPMVTKLLAELLEKGSGGGRAVYAAKPEFIELIYEKKPSRTAGGFNLVARELGIGVDNTFVRVRRGDNCDREIAEKVAKYYSVPLLSAFEKRSMLSRSLRHTFLKSPIHFRHCLRLASRMVSCFKTPSQTPRNRALVKWIYPHTSTIRKFRYSLTR